MRSLSLALLALLSPAPAASPHARSPGVAGDRAGVLPAEFRRPHRMDVEFLRRLSHARRLAGVPFRIESSFRSYAENALVDGVDGSAHLEDPCRAVDLAVRGNEERFRVVEALMAEGFTRIGIYPAREDGSGIVHVDAAGGRSTPRLWTRSR